MVELPDLITLEYPTRGRPFLRVFRNMRRNGNMRQIPVLLLLDPGADPTALEGYVEKPITELDLIRTIGKALNKRLKYGPEWQQML